MTENNFNQELQKIKERNERVELDKAWEISLTRRVYILTITYATAAIWLLMIHDSKPWLKAFVPTAAYLLSTLTLPPLKRWWARNHKK
jgi:hypothetical protein